MSEMVSLEVQSYATTRGILRLALPLAAGAGVNYAMQFVNRLFLSSYSPEALAASLPAGMMAYAMQCFFFSSAAYVGAFAAQHHGAGEYREAGAMAWPMLWLAVIAGVLSLGLIPMSHTIFSLFGAEPLVTDNMATLGAWYCAETGPAVIIAGMAGFFGGIGRSGLVAVMSIGVCILSIGLNWWFIFGGCGLPALGIAGAGLATVLATIVGAGGWLFLFWSPTMRRTYGTWSMRNGDYKRVMRYVRYGLPRGGTEALEMFSLLLFTAGVTRLGTESLAASNIALSLYLLVFVPLTGFGQGVTIAVGQSMGAGRVDIARAATHRSVGIALVVVLAWVFMCFFGTDIIAVLFTLDGVEQQAQQRKIINALSAGLMPLLALLGICDGFHLIYRCAVQGAGDTRWPLVALAMSAVFLLGIPVWWLMWGINPETWITWGIEPLQLCWIIMVLYVAVIACLMTWRFYRGPWATMSLRR